MGNAILMLDGLSIAGAAHYLGAATQRKVELAENVGEAESELNSDPGKYAVLLVEPFLYYQKDTSPLQKLMQETREDGGLPVIVFSTQDEKVVNDEFLLKKGIHYDGYVCKTGGGSPEKMLKTLETLLHQ